MLFANCFLFANLLFYCVLNVDVCCVIGLRGAIAFALSLHIEIEKEKREVLVTATLIIVLFTLLFLGGGTMPLMTVCLFKKVGVVHLLMFCVQTTS